MTQKEFFERTGIKLSEAEYNKVEAMYYGAGGIDKDKFCQDYKKHHDSILIQVFYDQDNILLDKLENKMKIISETAMFLVDQAEKCASSDLRDKAIEFLGMEKYLSVKIQKGYNIWDIDKDDLIKILNNK